MIHYRFLFFIIFGVIHYRLLFRFIDNFITVVHQCLFFHCQSILNSFIFLDDIRASLHIIVERFNFLSTSFHIIVNRFQSILDSVFFLDEFLVILDTIFNPIW